MFGEEILQEIDLTLDQLIKNATAVDVNTLELLDDTEKEAFQKTQESLLAHLMHVDQRLVDKRENLKKLKKNSARFKIQEKLLRLESLQEHQTTLMNKEFEIVKRHHKAKPRRNRFRSRTMQK